MKKLLLILGLLLLPSTSYAKWRVEKVYDPLFETTTTVISTTGYAVQNGNTIAIRYAFLIDQNKDVMVELRSDLVVFNVQKIEDTTGNALTAVWMKIGKNALKTYFHVGKSYKFIFAYEKEIVDNILAHTTAETRMRLNEGMEDQFDVVFKTAGLKQLVEKYRR